MNKTSTLALALASTLWIVGCGESGDDGHSHGPGEGSHTHADGTVHGNETQDPKPDAANAGTHTHADGTVHSNESHAPDPAHKDTGTHTHADGTVHSNAEHAGDAGHEASEPLAPATIGDMKVQLAQGHGSIKPGQESHLVVKLPYNDKGATVVRAWIGTEDRTLSMVGKGDYTAASNRFDIHAAAPRILPENTLWWIEIEKPDGTKVVGSAKPITE